MHTDAFVAACGGGQLAKVQQAVGRDAALVNAKHSGGDTGLMRAAHQGHTEVLEYLLGQRADVNAADNNKRTALMFAAEEGHARIVRLLLEAGADKTLEGKYGQTAADFARERNTPEVLALLEEKEPPTSDHSATSAFVNVGAGQSKPEPEPRLSSISPTTGPTAGGVPITLRGDYLGVAFSRGELTLLLSLPGASHPELLVAAHVSDNEISATMPPSDHTGFASIRLQPGEPMCEFLYTRLESLYPTSGPSIAGGVPITLRGDYLGRAFLRGDITLLLSLPGARGAPLRRAPLAADHVSEHEISAVMPTSRNPGVATIRLQPDGPPCEFLFARLNSISPSSGLTTGNVPITLSGDNLGKALSRGGLTLLLSLPGARQPVPLAAAYVSEHEISAAMPPCGHTGVATIRLQPDGPPCDFCYEEPFTTIFGYGSILDPASARRDLPGMRNHRPALITEGWRRVFSLVGVNNMRRGRITADALCCAVLAIRCEPGAPALVGCLLEIPERELPDFRRRESRYNIEQIEVVDSSTGKDVLAWAAIEQTDVAYRAAVGPDQFEHDVGQHYRGTLWGRQDIQPEKGYLKLCIGAMEKLDATGLMPQAWIHSCGSARENFKKETLLADGKTTVKTYWRFVDLLMDDARQRLFEAMHVTMPDDAWRAASIQWKKRVQEGKIVPVFGIGSNNVEQLCARLEQPNLVALPAVLPGYVRVFGGPNKGWSVDGRLGGRRPDGRVATASLLERRGGELLGSIVMMTPDLIAKLDVFEGFPKTYKCLNVDVVLHDPHTRRRSDTFPALVYTRVTSLTQPIGPSEAYKCACLRTVKQSFPEVEGIPILNADGHPTAIGEWTHPGFGSLTLPAFLYEVGARKSPPWTMPKDITTMIQKLEDAKFEPMTMSAADFVEKIEEINAALEAEEHFDSSTIEIARRLVREHLNYTIH